VFLLVVAVCVFTLVLANEARELAPMPADFFFFYFGEIESVWV
jgi:hypothetical protein